jgi:hypothetical protein
VTAFPWLILILLLTVLAWLLLSACGSAGCLVRERRIRLSRPALRFILALTICEFALVLAWGLVLRPR